MPHGLELVGLVACRAEVWGKDLKLADPPVLRSEGPCPALKVKPDAARRVQAHLLKHRGAEPASAQWDKPIVLERRTIIGEAKDDWKAKHPTTPDGRYFVVRGRLWRTSNPALMPDRRDALVRELMAARRAVRGAHGDPEKLADARAAIDAAKVALGERRPPWWKDGAPDYNRKMARSTPYAVWFEGVSGA